MNVHQEKLELAHKIITEMKESKTGMKPIFSQLAKETGVSRQTLAKMWKNYDNGFKEPRKRKSKFDPYREEIIERFNSAPVSIKEVFLSFQHDDPEGVFTSYDSFKSYVRSQHLRDVQK